MDLRERILAAVHEGKESMPKIAIRFSVSHKMVRKLKYQWRDIGTLEPQTHKVERKRLLSDKQCERLDKSVCDDPSLTLERPCTKLRVDCCLKTIWMERRRQGTRTKRTLHASEQERSDVKERRISWKKQQRRLDVSKFVYLDETGAEG